MKEMEWNENFRIVTTNFIQNQNGDLDIIAKYFALPINTITALMGIPIVIYIVTRRR